MFLQGEGCSVFQGSVWTGAAVEGGGGVPCAFSPSSGNHLGLAFGTASNPWRKQKPEQPSFESHFCDSCGSQDSERLSQSRKSFSGWSSDSTVPLPGLLVMLSEYLSHASGSWLTR